MESIIWLILGFILIALSLTLICVWIVNKKEGNVGIYAYLIWLMTFWGVWFVLGYDSTRPVHANNKKLTIEIRQELLNGKIISTDTLYKFTPKKK